MSSIMQNAGGDKPMNNPPSSGEVRVNDPASCGRDVAAPSVEATMPGQDRPTGSNAQLHRQAFDEDDNAPGSTERSPERLEAEAGGAGKRPPARPIILDDPDDIPDFLDDLENEARGAETKKQVWSVEPYIRAAREQGYPIGRIFLGLSRRGKIKVKKTQFEKVCRKEFPELF